MPSTAAASSAVIARRRLGRRVGPVGQQREMELAVRTGEVVDLEPLDLLLDRRARRQQRRHRDQVRRSGGTPSRSASAGSSVAPKPR